jgi:hypothetical protein
VALDRNGRTFGLLLLTFRIRSKDAGTSTVTVPFGVPASPPTTLDGTMVNETGTASGIEPDCRTGCLAAASVGTGSVVEQAESNVAVTNRESPSFFIIDPHSVGVRVFTDCKTR